KYGQLVIVDDHKLFRNGLKLLIREEWVFEEVTDFPNGIEFLAYIEKYSVDLVLMDINMPIMNGIDATRAAIEKRPEISIIALSMLSDDINYYKMIEAGAKGFVLKDAGSEELHKAIDTVMSGDSYFSGGLMKNILMSLNVSARSLQVQENPGVKFSPREIEILEQICKGLSNQEIAEILFISPRTVERHRANLFDKTGARNSVNLVMYAIKNNLVKV
ncbi:MAG: response regulator transcription factor, partial [Bacteroidetes bacterium]|nr:response regulator transcription factor [Bacteroidota bacterium]